MSVKRRALTLGSLDDLRRELDALEAAQRAGTLVRTGQREPGAILWHLAVAIRGSFDGMPELEGAAPLWLRVVGPLMKSRVLARPLQPGVRMNAKAERALWDDGAKFEDALALLRAQVERLRGEQDGPREKHPIFGRLTPAEWRRFHLRHAELHLGFLDPGAAGRGAPG